MSAALLAVLLSSAPVSVDFRGTLGEALSTIATQGGINLIATGDLNVPAEVHLKDVSAEEALEALVKVHHLQLAHEGKVWFVKPADRQKLGAVPPVPPVAPQPPAAAEKKVEDSDDDDAVSAAEQRAEEAKERAEEAKDRAERARDAKQAEADARKEEVAAQVEEAKARVDEYRAKAQDLKSNQRVGTGSITIADGEHVQDVVTYGGSVTLGDGVLADGSVVAFGGDVLMGDGVRVNGDAVSVGGVVKKGDGSVVKGQEVSFGTSGFGIHSIPTVKPSVSPHTLVVKEESGGVAAFLINFATFFGLGFLLMMFAPVRMRNIEIEIQKEPVKSGLAGLLAMLGAIPLTVLLVLTVIGIPFMVVGWLLAGLAMVMGLLALANTLGSRIPLRRFKRTQAVVLAVGLLVMMLLSMVPVLGPLLITASLCVSFGAIIRTRVGQRALAGVPIPDDKFISP